MKEKQFAQLRELVKKEIESHIIPATGQALPIGYNPIEKIRNGLFHWIAVPFNGTDIFCELRCPNATQLEQCGDISNITLQKDEKEPDKKFSYDEIIKIRNYQEELCKLVLNRPTFDHIGTLVGDNDFVISEKREELKRIEKYFQENKNTMTEVEKNTTDTRIKTLELQLGFILPDDTMAFLTRWAMGNDVSDIKRITKENFLRAASLARAHRKAPHEYLSGVFTDYNKPEIDSYAFMLLDEFIKEQEAMKKGKHKWFLGGRKKNVTLPKQSGGK